MVSKQFFQKMLGFLGFLLLLSHKCLPAKLDAALLSPATLPRWVHYPLSMLKTWELGNEEVFRNGDGNIAAWYKWVLGSSPLSAMGG